MDYSKFPHQGGTPSREGERQARFLDGIDVPFLRRQNLDGSVSRKAGGRLYVDPAPPAAQVQPSTFLSIGLVEGQRRVDALRALKPQGNFDPRGTLAGDGGLTGGFGASAGDIPRRLAPFARGFAFTRTLLDDSALETGSDGRFYARRTLAVDKTKDGNTFERVATHQVWSDTASGVDGESMFLAECLPTVLANGVQLSAGFGFVGPNGSGSADFRFMCWRGDTLADVRPVPSPLPGTPGYKRGFIPFTTSPAGRVAFVYTESYPATVGPDYSGLVLVFSADGGQTWSAPVYPEGLFDVGPRESGSWASIAPAIPPFVVPITSTRAIACTAAYNPTGWLGSPSPWVRIKLVVIDSAARTVESKAVLAEGPALGFRDIIGSAIPIAGGALFTLKTPWRSGSPLLPHPYDLAVECWFTTDGSDPVHKGTMPWSAGQTGPLFAIDKNTVGCCVFADGEGYSVYASKDLGATWERWASINADVSLVVEDRYSYLNDFESVVRLPGNPTPGAPWITDARVAAPA